MISKRKIIEIDEELCTGCGECVPDCAEGSLQIIDGKAKLVSDNLCDGLGACLGSCPTGALKIVEREAEEFDEEAVEKFLTEQKKKESTPGGGGCPSAQIKTMQPITPCQAANVPTAQKGGALSHWPVQIRLIPPNAPFLENCDLLIAADCTAVSYGSLHEDFIQGRVVMMGCPKFDDQQMYVDRFTELFKTRKLNSVTILIMEVPCCSSMLQIVKKAYDDAGADVAIRQVVISTEGQLLSDTTW
ncbi:MAG: 4Fe-4S ferredoxin [Desulfobulbus sp.]|nr:MAG: 4Fe-4S ferredoxin [Desulfobulbus sp.]RUM37431.1 MAG: 4Fe-4S ferredoxin [Desulfobulbus sp.]RUM39383.1 MAG: 4Fe-4S ferredoxin [Desulfobulbus sp.]